MFDDKIAQIQLPDSADTDPHPRMLVEGRGLVLCSVPRWLA